MCQHLACVILRLYNSLCCLSSSLSPFPTSIPASGKQLLFVASDASPLSANVLLTPLANRVLSLWKCPSGGPSIFIIECTNYSHQWYSNFIILAITTSWKFLKHPRHCPTDAFPSMVMLSQFIIREVLTISPLQCAKNPSSSI